MEQGMNRHSFVICAYKESPYLEACILSLKGQSVTSDILMVTSTPNAHIKRLAEKYEISLFINQGAKGISQDWNFAYHSVKTDYVTIAHQDDLYLREYTENTLSMLGRSKKPLIFFSDYAELRQGRAVARNRNLSIKRLMLMPLRIRPLQRIQWVRRRILALGNPICCPSVTYCRKNLPSSLFSNHFLSNIDWEAWENFSRLPGDFVYTNKILMEHRIHEDSTTTLLIQDQMRWQEDYRMFCKFWPPFIARFLIRLYKNSERSNSLDMNVNFHDN